MWIPSAHAVCHPVKHSNGSFLLPAGIRLAVEQVFETLRRCNRRAASSSDSKTTVHRPVSAAAMLIVVIAAAAMIGCRDVLAEPPLPIGRSDDRSSAALIAAAVFEAADRFAISVHWIRAVMHAESNGDPRARSAKGAIGLMQIMPRTWADLRAKHRLGADPYDARDNILAGAAYLRELLDRYGVPGFLAAYNAGPGRYEQHLATGKPLPDETQAYVATIMSNTADMSRVAVSTVAKHAVAGARSPLFVDRLTSHLVARSDSVGVRSGRGAKAPLRIARSDLVPRSAGLFASTVMPIGSQ